MVDGAARAGMPSPQDGTTSAAFSTTDSGRAMKVPIPRLHRANKGGDDPGAPATGDKHRVSHACEPCRQRKTKCSGERPICKHCADFKITCFYAGGKRDRAKTEMATLKAKVELYEQLLGQLKGQVDSAGQLAINKVLRGSYLNTSGGELPPLIETRDGESLVSAEVGSTGSLDHIREDMNSEHTTYPMGYMGKSSEVAWIQKVAQQLAKEARNGSPPLPDEDDEIYQFTTSTYHLDDVSVSISGDTVNPYLLPDKQVADRLVEAFFGTVHPSFPIVMRGIFMDQYELFFGQSFPSSGYSAQKWLAMLNLIFAIGSLYGKLVNSQWKGSDKEHLKYFARARTLSLDDGSLFEAADIQQVQLVGLTAMYLLASNQTNRAWNVIGLAIRYAQTLGLNLRNAVPDLSEVEKELRARVWYALYGIEHLLCLMTGRPTAIQDRDCSVPLPRPVDELSHGMESFEVALHQYSAETVNASCSSPAMNIHSLLTPTSYPSVQTPVSQVSNTPTRRESPTEPNSAGSRGVNHAGMSPQISHSPRAPRPSKPSTSGGSTAAYFLEHIKLTRITCAVLSGLYSPDTVKKSWSDVQGIISSLELELVRWKAQLPPFLDFTGPRPNPGFVRERMSLAFQYHHARVLINRPCLCRMDSRIPNESSRSRSFNRSAAATCISAAREIVAYIHDVSDCISLVAVSPWWCLLHYIVAAGVILMVEMSMRAEHNPQQADALLRDTKKVVKWLRTMSKDNIAAERSWTVLNKLLIVSAPKIGGDTSDVERDLEHRGPAPVNPVSAAGPVTVPTPQTGTPLGSSGGTPAAFQEIPYLFRGQFDHNFRLSPMPHQHFDNMLASLSDTSSMAGTPGPSVMSGTVFAVEGKPPTPLPSLTPTDPPNSRFRERLKKRHSLGVSHIAIPPPPPFAQWSSPASTADFSAESARQGKDDYEAAVHKVQSDPSLQGPAVDRVSSKRPADFADD